MADKKGEKIKDLPKNKPGKKEPKVDGLSQEELDKVAGGGGDQVARSYPNSRS